MNELDVMESLKQKEEELEGLINEAREKGEQIRKDALHKAEEARLSMEREVEGLLNEFKQEEMKKVNSDVEAIKAEAIKKAEEFKVIADKRLKKAVEMVMQYVLGDETLKE